jgi:hypothetical protein
VDIGDVGWLSALLLRFTGSNKGGYSVRVGKDQIPEKAGSQSERALTRTHKEEIHKQTPPPKFFCNMWILILSLLNVRPSTLLLISIKFNLSKFPDAR